MTTAEAHAVAPCSWRPRHSRCPWWTYFPSCSMLVSMTLSMAWAGLAASSTLVHSLCLSGTTLLQRAAAGQPPPPRAAKFVFWGYPEIHMAELAGRRASDRSDGLDVRQELSVVLWFPIAAQRVRPDPSAGFPASTPMLSPLDRGRRLGILPTVRSTVQ